MKNVRTLVLTFAGGILFAGVTHAETFASWQAAHFTTAELLDTAASGENADPDGDGRSNLIEYAFGLDPWVAEIGPSTMPTVVDGHLQLTYSRPVNISDLAYIPQVTTDLVSWYTGDTYVETLSTTDTGQVRSVVLQDRSTADPTRFLRLLVTRDSDQDGLPDDWEMQYFGNLDSLGSDDNDLDTLTNLTEYHEQTDPTDYYNGATPQLQIVSGNGQTGEPDTILPVALNVQVLGADGTTLLVNAPVTFALSQGQGALQVTGTSTPVNSITARTDSNGRATVWFHLPNLANQTSQITATAGSGNHSTQVSFSEQSGNFPPLPSRTNLQVVYNDDGSLDMSWDNNTDSAADIPIQIEQPDHTWTTVATVPAGSTSCHIPPQ